MQKVATCATLWHGGNACIAKSAAAGAQPCRSLMTSWQTCAADLSTARGLQLRRRQQWQIHGGHVRSCRTGAEPTCMDRCRTELSSNHRTRRQRKPSEMTPSWIPALITGCRQWRPASPAAVSADTAGLSTDAEAVWQRWQFLPEVEHCHEVCDGERGTLDTA
jgi:hypothetical protein